MSNGRQYSPKEDDLRKIHTASMEILAKVGVVFHFNEAVDLFKKHGFKTEGLKVFIEESHVQNALSTCPEYFVWKGRDPEKAKAIGLSNYLLLPTYGPPFIIDTQGNQRRGTMEDYEKAVKLNHSSDVSEAMGFRYVAPDNATLDTYLDMLSMAINLSDKPLMGATDDGIAAADTMELMEIVYGKGALENNNLAVGLINPLSPLGYAGDMAHAIMVYSSHRQPLVIVNMIMAGMSGPIRIPNLLALMNAELLAGIVLAQLNGPGTPIVYGTTSCPANLKTGLATVGNPETVKIASITMELAKFYHLPCRTGGSLTDSLLPDGQAMAEGTLALTNAIRGGANFILHAFGMLGGYIGLSFEKWIMDEELSRYINCLMDSSQESFDDIDISEIAAMGSSGNYLYTEDTLKLCRKAFVPSKIFNKGDLALWQKEAKAGLFSKAQSEIEHRLKDYSYPQLEPSLQKDILSFISKKRRTF
ncbi:MAG: trimethylamine methyltransferase family protein [Deltaproteobacteria bacterium]|nr:trimethylamine methyltransferase family protein [Deltaproteobacteria bacterium]